MTREVRNDRKNGVTQFCLTMEQHRRTEAGRVRTAKEMLDIFFPRTGPAPEDKIFHHLPPEVRGPIVSGWGVRGAKSAVRDSDEKIRQVVFDALAAGDIDETSFENGIDAQTLIDWAPLVDWWSFWRTGKLTGVAIQKALAVARELELFDDRWFLQNVEGRGGKLKGTDTLCDTLSKDQIVGWIRKLHESGDGSPAGLVAAVSWETILAKTSQEALLFALDAFATKVGLVHPQVMKTEMPRGDENVPVPEIPAAPRVSLDPTRGVVAPAAAATAPEAATPRTPVPVDETSWSDLQQAPAQSGTMLSVEEPKPKVSGPPPVPTTRKGAR